MKGEMEIQEDKLHMLGFGNLPREQDVKTSLGSSPSKLLLALITRLVFKISLFQFSTQS